MSIYNCKWMIWGYFHFRKTSISPPVGCTPRRAPGACTRMLSKRSQRRMTSLMEPLDFFRCCKPRWMVRCSWIPSGSQLGKKKHRENNGGRVIMWFPQCWKTSTVEISTLGCTSNESFWEYVWISFWLQNQRAVQIPFSFSTHILFLRVFARLKVNDLASWENMKTPCSRSVNRTLVECGQDQVFKCQNKETISNQHKYHLIERSNGK